MPSSKLRTSYRDVLIIGVLIGGVCFVTLTPAMYLVFHALQWEGALRIVETVFLPALLLAVTACLLAYQHARARRALWKENEPHEEHSSPLENTPRH
jgi:uncharacterized membrane protein YfcA